MFGLTRRPTKVPVPRFERPLGWLVEEFEPLFNRMLTWPVMETSEWPYRYAVTTEEKEKEVVVRFELPGFAAEEVKVELTGDMLTVEAEHKEPAEEGKTEKEEVHVRRTMTVPAVVEAEKVEATYRNGVLEVHLPRKPETMGRRIEVKT